MILTLFSKLVFLVLGNTLPCPPPITEMPVLVTWYDPALGGINCDVDCTTYADGTLVTPDDYGQVSACIPEWLGASITIDGLGTFACRDTGSAIVVDYNEYYRGWVIHVDILHEEPPDWNYQLRHWQLNWSPVPEPSINSGAFLTVGGLNGSPGCSEDSAQPATMQPAPPEQFFSANRLTYTTNGMGGNSLAT